MNKWWKPVIVVLITLALAVSVKNDFLYFLLGFEIMLYLASFVQVRYAVEHVRAHAVVEAKEITRTTPFIVRVHLENQGILPIPQVRIRVALQVFPEKEELLLTGKTMLGIRESGDLCFSLDSTHCEAVRIRMDKLVVSDFFDSFFRNGMVDQEESSTVFILPNLKQDSAEVSPEISAEKNEEGDSDRRGNSFIDEAEIRDYQIKDPIKLIHWKLSAKLDRLMVREMADQTEECVILYVNLKDRKDEENVRRNPDRWDLFCTRLAELSRALLIQKKEHRVFWIDAAMQKVVHYSVRSEEDRIKMLSALLLTDSYEDEDVSILLREIYSDETKENCLEINLQGDTYRREGTR